MQICSAFCLGFRVSGSEVPTMLSLFVRLRVFSVSVLGVSRCMVERPSIENSGLAQGLRIFVSFQFCLGPDDG